MRKQILASALAAMMMVGTAVPSFATSVTAGGVIVKNTRATGIASATDTMDELSVTLDIYQNSSLVDSVDKSDTGVARVQKPYSRKGTYNRIYVTAMGTYNGRPYIDNFSKQVA